MKQAWRAAEARKIASAAYFTVVRLLGHARYERYEEPSLAAALARRAAMGRDSYGRVGMIYAVTPGGDTVFVE